MQSCLELLGIKHSEHVWSCPISVHSNVLPDIEKFLNAK